MSRLSLINKAISLFCSELGTRCPACGKMHQGVSVYHGCCQQCTELLSLRKGGYCPQCGLNYSNEGLPPYFCLKCRNRKMPWDGFGFYNIYTGLLRELVLQFKFNRDLSCAKVLKHLLKEAYKAHFTGFCPDALLPVPLHPKRLRERGFNQSLELAKGISGWLGVPVTTDALRRCRDTAPQSTLDRRKRWNNMAGSIVADQNQVKGRNVLLVDDILTTGATLHACAKALRSAGAESIHVLILARVPEN